MLHARETEARESVMHFELERKLSSEELMALCDRVRAVLGDVQPPSATSANARARAGMVEAARAAAGRYSADEVEEAVAFLGWLFEDNFVFLGYREYAIDAGTVAIVPGSGLGILADEATATTPSRCRSCRSSRSCASGSPAATAAGVEDEPVRDRAPARADGLRRRQARR